MPGPWFVDPVQGRESNNGLSPLTPWKLYPGQAGAAAQTGYGVAAGDLIRGRRGTFTTGQIVPPADNLTYGAYGSGSEPLRLTLPARNPMLKRIVRVGSPDDGEVGMWGIDASNNDVDGAAINTSTRAGLTFEDVDIIGPRVGARNAVTAGVSATNLSGFTMRRFRIRGATQRGISATLKSVLLEWGQVAFTLDDNVMLNCTAANGSRAGSSDVLRFLDLREPNRAFEGAPDTGTSGDSFQLVPNSAANSDCLGSLLMHDIYVFKSTASKQMFLFHDAQAGMVVRRVLGEGGGDIPILLGGIRGQLVLLDIVLLHPATEGLPTFRYERPDSGAAAYAIAAGGRVALRNCMSLGRQGGFFSLVEDEGVAAADGSLDIDNCTAIGTNINALSWASTLAFRSSTDQVVYGASFRCRVRNSIMSLDGGAPNIRMPTGTAGTDQFVLQGNVFADAPYNIGTSSYASIAQFQAAHSRATANQELELEQMMLTEAYAPKHGSPLLSAGVDLGYLRDIRGNLSRRHVGAIGRGRLAFAA